MSFSHLRDTLNAEHLPSGNPDGPDRVHPLKRELVTGPKGASDGGAPGRLARHSSDGASPLFNAHSGSVEDAARSALENTTDNASASRRISVSKWSKLDYLRTDSLDKRQRQCMTRPIGTTVGIRVNSYGIGVAGVMRCGKTICPACGPRIAAERRHDIQLAVDNWRGQGKTVLMMTLTLRHSRADRLADMTSAIGKCWRASTSGRSWLRDRKEFGVVHTIRAWEEKWSIENGWHAHVHVLLFIDAPAGSDAVSTAVDGLLPVFFERWAATAIDCGLRAPLIAGQDLHEVVGDEAGHALGDYFAKQSAGTADKTSEDMAWEMSNPNGKARGDSFTPGEILDLASGGDSTMQALWSEYENAMRGRRTISWSTGLRAALCIEPERSNEEIVDEEIGVAEDTLISMTSKSWVKLSRVRGARFELLSLVLTEGPLSALDWLMQRGYVATAGLHDYGEDPE